MCRHLCLHHAAQAQKLVVFSVRTDVEEGGRMAVTYSADAIPTQAYGSNSTLVAILVLQILFVVGMVWNIMEEVQQMIHCMRVYGTLLSYFDSAWNWLDIASTALQIVGIALW